MAKYLTRLQTSEQAHNSWWVRMQEGETLQTFIAPEYLAHVARRLRQFDTIELVAFDGSWCASLIVAACGANYAKVKVTHFCDLEDSVSDAPPAESVRAPLLPEGSLLFGNLEVMFAGRAKWRIVHFTSREVMADGIQTKAEAIKWAQDHLAKMAA